MKKDTFGFVFICHWVPLVLIVTAIITLRYLLISRSLGPGAISSWPLLRAYFHSLAMAIIFSIIMAAFLAVAAKFEGRER